MPKIDHYIAEVTVSVRLVSSADGALVQYSVTRKASGGSGGGAASAIIETATSAASAGARIMASGVDNSEARRLK